MFIRSDSPSFKRLVWMLALLGMALASLPMVSILLMSFNATAELNFPPTSYSLHWYRQAFSLFKDAEHGGDSSAWSALVTSIMVGLSVMLISVVVCVPLAYALVRDKRRWTGFVETLATLPLTFPLVSLGLAFLLLAESLPFELGIMRLVIPHLTLALPFVLRNCLSTLYGVGTELEEAAISLGASWSRAFWDVILPIMKPGIVAGMTFAFVVSFNEFTVTFFMYTVDFSTLPLWMYSRTVSSLDPTALALSSFIILIDVVTILAIDRFAGGTRSVV